MDASSDPLAVVTRFCAAWGEGDGGVDVDALVAFFTDDAEYHNIPVDPVVGRDAIRSTIAGFTTGVERVEFEVRNVAAAGDVVLTERVDRFFRSGASTIVLPVMGTFEVRDGLIAAWRDYFDMNQFMSQLGS
jgi:limonene-1,2-epoxide hydrolase